MVAPVSETPDRRAFYERISRENLTRLWLSLASLVTPSTVVSRPRGPSATFVAQ
jgi:hypothetical protein